MVQPNAAQRDTRILPAGVAAPDFTLDSLPGKSVSLGELRGHPVVLIFYPADWSPVCGDELALFNELLPSIQESGATVLGISVDGVWCHRAFAEARHLAFPLLADFEPKGQVSRAYGAYRPAEGVSARALFVIDSDGLIRWSHLSPVNVNPGADGVLKALDAMQGGGGGDGGGRSGAGAGRHANRQGAR
jgi:peroxiredoxin